VAAVCTVGNNYLWRAVDPNLDKNELSSLAASDDENWGQRRSFCLFAKEFIPRRRRFEKQGTRRMKVLLLYNFQ
jgi:hypothetical protein